MLLPLCGRCLSLAHTSAPHSHLGAHRSGHLPLWAPVLGLESEVARFNSLPPCLFMTLGTVASLLAAGQCIKAVGIRELQRFDK